MTTTARKPDPNGRIKAALTRYRVMAWATGIWLLILVTEMVYKYGVLESSSDAPHWFLYIAQAHGLFYFLFLITAADLGTKARWDPVKLLLTALAGTVPFLSFWFEHKRTQEVRAAYEV